MPRINLGERNEQAMFAGGLMKQLEYPEEIEEPEEPPLRGNDAVKREMASELLKQGLTEAAVCRILNLTEEQLPDDLPF